MKKKQTEIKTEIKIFFLQKTIKNKEFCKKVVDK